jgi:hypothetical protein
LIIFYTVTASKVQMKLFTATTANLPSLAAYVILAVLLSCSPRYAAYIPKYQAAPAEAAPNYRDLFYWAAHPWKPDPSDSIPAGITDRTRDSLVDVFFIHPTTYTKRKQGWNAHINDAALNAKTDYTSILYQASVFNQHARVFAPRYRQAHLSTFFSDSSVSKLVLEQAYADVRRAFQHYLEAYNGRRPIIIAGHSQGAVLAKMLLREFFEDKPLQSQLVAAYVIGWPVQQTYFRTLPVCTTPQQTGCFCSWRTLREGYTPRYVEREPTTAYVTNPLNWSTNGDYAPRELNKGSVLRNFDRVVPHTTDARIHEGILWVKKPRFPGSALYVVRNYHVGDINLFYMNLRSNVEERIYAFLGKRNLGLGIRKNHTLTPSQIAACYRPANPFGLVITGLKHSDICKTLHHLLPISTRRLSPLPTDPQSHTSSPH